jgi:SAM-dependent methyltransferase
VAKKTVLKSFKEYFIGIYNVNLVKRKKFLKAALDSLQPGSRILDAGAGELDNKIYCQHLEYISQDLCQYTGNTQMSSHNDEGLHMEIWNTSKIDIVSDITDIPLPDESLDAILCSEVLEHIPSPTLALDEFRRLLKPGGTLILTAPFSSNVHMAPYYFCTGFSRYWYEYHLSNRNFSINTLTPNGNWYLLLRQELFRILLAAKNKNIVLLVSLGFLMLPMLAILSLFRDENFSFLACFGYHCQAIKKEE